ncbi:AAA family ATPase, partial [Bacteroides thetaiotaomicron]|uniref:AAA family ATPase n=1 Tax=Bacteroides thetaiotaomicron TaxID=818 RepID=UPI001CE29627
MASNFLKLISLSIKGYKNIKALQIDFEAKKGISVLIGKNGCGKSHVLEAFSSIFAGWYNKKLYEP